MEAQCGTIGSSQVTGSGAIGRIGGLDSCFAYILAAAYRTAQRPFFSFSFLVHSRRGARKGSQSAVHRVTLLGYLSMAPEGRKEKRIVRGRGRLICHAGKRCYDGMTLMGHVGAGVFRLGGVGSYRLYRLEAII